MKTCLWIGFSNFTPMIQAILVLCAFAAAIAFLGRSVYKAFRSKSGCSSGCGKCGAVDFEKISKQLSEKGV